MRVFNKDKFIQKNGLGEYYSNSFWIDKCNMHTEEECRSMGRGIKSDYFLPCREVCRKAKKGEYVRIVKVNDYFFLGNIVVCSNDNFSLSYFKNEGVSSYPLHDSFYVVREIVEEKEDMKNVKQLLENGDMVITRDGERYVFMKDYLGQNVFKDKDGEFIYRENYSDELRNTNRNEFDIMEIKKPKRLYTKWFNEADYETKWKREEVKEMTVAEIEKALGYSIKVVKEEK